VAGDPVNNPRGGGGASAPDAPARPATAEHLTSVPTRSLHGQRKYPRSDL